jgi:predicted outer membrane repeat protein
MFNNIQKYLYFIITFEYSTIFLYGTSSIPKNIPIINDNLIYQHKERRETVIEERKQEVIHYIYTLEGFRKALKASKDNGKDDRIILDKGIYKVTSDNLGTFIFKDHERFNLTIEGKRGFSNQEVILDGEHTHQVLNFSNTEKSSLILKNLSIINGNSSTSGGGIFSNQDIKIENCEILNNRTVGDGKNLGGGFYTKGKAIINASIISNNSSKSSSFYKNYGNGGGFYSSVTTLYRSIISENTAFGYGGGFYSDKISIMESTISNNQAKRSGGGFYGIKSSIINSKITNNSTENDGGGFYSLFTTIKSSIIKKNKSEFYGGGFYSEGLTLNSSFIAENSAKRGGGFENGFNDVFILNTIFLKNSAKEGAIFNSSAFNSKQYISNNLFLKNRGGILTQGIFINNIFKENEKDLILLGDSVIYNNYIDNRKIRDNGFEITKKRNLEASVVGEVYLTQNYKDLQSSSVLRNKGIDPTSRLYKKIIGNEQEVYMKILKLFNTKRVIKGLKKMGPINFTISVI